ncbi:uncharacterized protein YukE [Streptacidiphilus sp. MAP12-16]|uniref:hypothetical protein n=1 Tax=Streptacidiphilus sp. MAP12-16 TaxID=3156300 RepID=UPI0035114A1F
MSGYEVDLGYLKATVSKLQGVVDGMNDTHNKANYETILTRTQVGSEAFGEAGTLHAAHDTMQTSLTAMIKTLQTMIQEFADKTNHVHNTYSQNETNTAGNFGK